MLIALTGGTVVTIITVLMVLIVIGVFIFPDDWDWFD